MNTLTRSSRADGLELLRALPVDVEQHVARRRPAPSPPARAACRSNCRTPWRVRAARRVDHPVERGRVDEEIVDALDLARPLRARRHRHRHRDVRVALEQRAGDRRLAGAGRRRQHQHQAAALDLEVHGSFDVLHLLAQLSIDGLEREADLRQRDVGRFRAQRVGLAVELLARKSSLRPTAPPSASSARAAAIWARSRSSSSRTSPRVASSATSWASRSSGNAGGCPAARRAGP